MKKLGLKKVFISILAIGLITNTMGLLQPLQSYEVENDSIIKETNQDTIIFDQEYPKLDQPLTLTTNLTGTLTYKWIVGNKVVSKDSSYSPAIKDLENFIEVEISNGIKTLSTKTYFSRLPVVYVNTENGVDVTSKDYYINGEMKIQGNEQFNLETTKLYDGKIEIKGRGNSTWGLPKKPYKIKLDSGTNLFSMGKNKHWVLLANYYDSSSLRNTLSYDLSGALDMPQTETVHTGVVFNGKYVGVYQFCEQIRVDEKRVDVLNWDDEAKDLAELIADQEDLDAGDLEDFLVENLSWITSGKVEYQGTTYLISNYNYTVPNIDGGYLLELDSNYDEVSRFKTKSDQPLMFKAPEFAVTNQDMMNYVTNYLQAYEDAVMSKDYQTLNNGNMVHYSDLFDMNSLVDYWLVTELFFNEDGMKKSTYMYQDVGEKFHMGPIWDMDWSSGANQSAAKPTDQWQTLYFPTTGNPDEPQLRQWYRYLIQDPYFVTCVKERYQEIRNNQLADMMNSIEAYRLYLKEAGIANSSIWYGDTNTGQNEITRLKSWLTDRLAFMDEKFSSFSQLYSSLGVKVSDEKLVLTDNNGIMLPTKDDYNGFSNANKTIHIDMSVSDQNTKSVVLYINGELVDKAQVVDGKVSFEYTPFVSESYVLQAYRLDTNNNIINEQAISANLLVGPEVVLDSIKIASLPNKLVYSQGEKLDLTGLIIEATYNNGTTKEITDYTISELTDKLGEQTITVNYQNKEITFTVMVFATSVVPNKTALSIAIEMAGAITPDQLDKLVPAVANEFKDALKNANTVFDNDAATQNQVDAAFDRLAKVMQMLEFYKGDKALLLDLLAEIANLEQSKDKYSKESWDALQAVLPSVNAVAIDENALQVEVDEAFSKLVTAYLNLRLIPNKDALAGLIKDAEGLKAGNYSAASFKAVQEALVEARGVLDNPNATVAQVNNASEALTKAIAGLEANSDKPVANQPGNTVTPSVPDTGKKGAAKTGDKIPAYGLLASLALVISFITVKKKKCS